jgi:phospholipid/cholesterol/gamma-HCH transport system ATP-binding protein
VPDAGRVGYDGHDIVGLGPSELMTFRRHIAFVFQSGALFDFLSVEDNLALFPRMHEHTTNEEVRRKSSMMLSLVGLDDSILPKFPGELSGGMNKRVAIARAMMKDPRYLFYDEPTAGLDRGSAEMIAELVPLLRRKNDLTSLIVTHDVQLMRQVADRVALLKRGKILFVGRTDDISPQALDMLYDTRGTNEL